jgi:hypothetical protein
MVGRVPVNVSMENGMIKSGDILVSGNKRGFAMKYVATNAPIGKPIGVVGIALEDLTQSEGKIMVLVRSGWVIKQTGESIQNASSQLASVSGDFVGLSVVDGPNGKIMEANMGIDMRGFALVNVGNIQGKNNNWSIDEKGSFVLRLETSGGSKDFYGMVSPESELVFSGSAALVSGSAEVKFADDLSSIIDSSQMIKVNITLTSGGVGGVYVESKDATGFKVRELQSNGGSASFDWMVIARRKNPETVSSVIDQQIPSNDNTTPEVSGELPTEVASGVASNEMVAEEITGGNLPAEVTSTTIEEGGNENEAPVTPNIPEEIEVESSLPENEVVVPVVIPTEVVSTDGEVVVEEAVLSPAENL